MIINKIIPGFVIQQWDTKKKAWVSQEFVAGDGCDVEYNDMGESDVDETLDPADVMDDSNGGEEPILNCDMVQPHP